MNEPEAWAIIVGTMAPMVVALIKQQGWLKEVNAILSFLVCLGIGYGNCYFQGVYDSKSLVVCMALTMAAAFTAFKMFYQPTGLDTLITNSTSLQKK